MFKGKKMAGRMGCVRVTIQNLVVVNTNREYGIIVVAGSVPGSKGSYVYIRDAIRKGFYGK